MLELPSPLKRSCLQQRFYCFVLLGYKARMRSLQSNCDFICINFVCLNFMKYIYPAIYHLFENELDKHLKVIFDYSFAHLRAHQEERAEYY